MRSNLFLLVLLLTALLSGCGESPTLPKDPIPPPAAPDDPEPWTVPRNPV